MLPTQVAPAAVCEQSEHHLLLHKPRLHRVRVSGRCSYPGTLSLELSILELQTPDGNDLLIEIPYVLEIFFVSFWIIWTYSKKSYLFWIYFVIFLILMQDEQILNTFSFTY